MQGKRSGLDDLIQAGLREHRAGRLEAAITLYEQVLEKQPEHPDALHLAGVGALQQGNAARAVELIQRAIVAQPRNPAFLGNLAQAHLASGQLENARAAFLQAAALDPGNAQFAVGAANCLALQGKPVEAEAQLRRVTQIHPANALGWYNLGNVVMDQGRAREAVQYYTRALQHEPGFADAHNNLGRALHALERFDDAERAYRQCLALRPDATAGYCNLASVLIDRGRSAEAAALCGQALQRVPPSAELYMMLGTALAREGRFATGLDAFRRAAEMEPHNQRAAWACGYALLTTGNRGDGLARMEAALAMQPDSPSLRDAMSSIYRSLGDLAAGWREYEWRASRRNFLASQPQRHPVTELPDDLAGTRVCLLGEEGLGDELFFLRYAPLLKSRGAQIAYVANPKLASILGRAPTLDRVTVKGGALPAFDVLMLIGDLPNALRHAAVPPPLALAALPRQLQEMKDRLAALGPPPYLGLTWRAGTAPEQQRGSFWVLHKEIPLEPFSSALRNVHGTLLALQRRPEDGEIAQLAEIAGRPVHDLTALNEDLEAMLALLALLDDYIGASNTNMHLRAGAGRTARVLVPQPPEWRWMAVGDESPWFPGFRVYRQGIDGDWSAALDRLARDLFAAFGAGAEVSRKP